MTHNASAGHEDKAKARVKLPSVATIYIILFIYLVVDYKA
jgi:hypothetical protein